MAEIRKVPVIDNQWVPTRSGRVPILRFMEVYKLFIRYVVCHQFIFGKKYVYFYIPKDKKYVMKRYDPVIYPHLDIRYATLETIYLLP